ncbi:MAG: hypothetical protein LC108_10020 [Anaerolineales bacterium]|nr:hypothetical protein [Anaerolineales bacterium]
MFAKPASIAALLFCLYLFAVDFPFYKFLEPQSAGWFLWMSYANDFIFAFAFYFFLCLGERWLKTWQMRAGVAFIILTLLELAQLLYPISFVEAFIMSPLRALFGNFDPFDIGAQTIGIGLAALVERHVFAKIFKDQQA